MKGAAWSKAARTLLWWRPTAAPFVFIGCKTLIETHVLALKPRMSSVSAWCILSIDFEILSKAYAQVVNLTYGMRPRMTHGLSLKKAHVLRLSSERGSSFARREFRCRLLVEMSCFPKELELTNHV